MHDIEYYRERISELESMAEGLESELALAEEINERLEVEVAELKAQLEAIKSAAADRDTLT